MSWLLMAVKGLRLMPTYHEIVIQKQKRKNFLPHWDLNHSPLEPKSSGLPTKLVLAPGTKKHFWTFF